MDAGFPRDIDNRRFFHLRMGLHSFCFGWAYIHFARTNPEALRTEQFLTQKLAIEKGVLGDKLSGVIAAEVAASLPRTIEEAPKQIEGDDG